MRWIFPSLYTILPAACIAADLKRLHDGRLPRRSHTRVLGREPCKQRVEGHSLVVGAEHLVEHRLSRRLELRRCQSCVLSSLET